MKLRSLILASAILLIGAPSMAQYEVRPSVEFETVWTDNVFGSSTREVDDTSFRVSPRVAVVRTGGDASWSLAYSPSFDYSIDDSGLRGWDHDLIGSWNWRITPQWTLRISDTFTRYRSIARLNEFTVDAGGDSSLEFRGSRRRFIRNIASGALIYGWSARQQTSMNLQFLSWDFSDEGRSDVEILQASLSHNYQWDKKTSLTLRASWRDRKNKKTQFFAGQKSQTYDLNLSAEHAFDPTLNLTIAAGPAYVRSNPSPTATSIRTLVVPFLTNENGQNRAIDAATCPTLDDGTPYFDASICQTILFPIAPNQIPFNGIATFPVTGTISGQDDGDFSYFANIQLVKRWERVTLDLRLLRRADDSSSVGANSVATQGTARLAYRVTERLTVSGSASYTIREQEVNSPTLVTTLTQAPVFIGPIFVTSVGARTGARLIVLGRDDDERVIRYSLRANWRMTDRIAFHAYAAYYDDEKQRAGLNVSEVQRLFGWLGVEYKFKPIQF